MVREDRRWAWQERVVLVFPFPFKGFWLRRGAEWVESVSSQDHNRVELSQPQRLPGTGVRKVVWLQYTLPGPMVPSAGCLDIRHYMQAGSPCQQPRYQLRGKSEVLKQVAGYFI